jgi:hypothetical protein
MSGDSLKTKNVAAGESTRRPRLKPVAAKAPSPLQRQLLTFAA